MSKLSFLFVLLCSTSLYAGLPADLPPDLKRASIIERLGETVDLNAIKLNDETGQERALATFFRPGRPVILSMIYFSCPSLCNFLLNGVTQSLRTLDWSVGNQFDVITVSMSPKETSALAAQKKSAYLAEYGRVGAETGWHFLTGSEQQIQKLADSIGFQFYYDEQSKEYAHSAGIFILTPEGKISRVLHGIDFESKTLRLSLLEASNGKIGSLVDRVLMFCYRYDPLKKGYSVAAFRLVQIGAVLTVVIVGIYFLVFWRGERRKWLDSNQNSDRSFKP